MLKLEKFLSHFLSNFNKFATLTINFSEVWPRQIVDLGKQFNLMVSLEHVLNMSWRCFSKTSWRRLENFLKTSGRRMAKTNILVLIKTSWRRLEDAFWRRMCKANIFVLIKTSWKRLHQDECLLGLVTIQKSSFVML